MSRVPFRIIVKTNSHEDRMRVRDLIGRYGDAEEVYTDHSMDFNPQSEACFLEIERILNSNNINFEKV